MATLADIIEEHIKRMFARAGRSVVEIRRCDVAEQFACVPSQINYVLETRFRPEHGYYVESRRGGGGYIRITQIVVHRTPISWSTIAEEIGVRMEQVEAEGLLKRLESLGAIDGTQESLIRGVLRQETADVRPPQDDVVRAKLLRGMLLVAMHTERQSE